MLYCKKCGAVVGENDMFCTSCSARLDSSSVVNKSGLRQIAAERQEFSADAATSETDLTGFSVMGMRLTDKLFSLMGSDYYRAVNANGEECIPLMMRHIIFPSAVDCDCAMLNNGADPSAAGALSRQFTEMLSKECLSFSAACASAGVPSINYRCEVMYSELNTIYHIFILMNDAVPLPLYLRKEQLTVRDALMMGGSISEELIRLDKNNVHYGAFSDCMIFVSGTGNQRKIYLDCRLSMCYDRFLPMSSYMSYFRQYFSPRRRNYEVYSLGMLLYRMLSQFRHPYINHRGITTSAEFLQAERLRGSMAEPYPPDCLQNTVGTVIRDAISTSQHELTMSEFSRVLINSLNYVQAGELNRTIKLDGTVGK